MSVENIVVIHTHIGQTTINGMYVNIVMIIIMEDVLIVEKDSMKKD